MKTIQKYPFIKIQGEYKSTANEIIGWLLKNDETVKDYLLVKKQRVFWKDGLSERARKI